MCKHRRVSVMTSEIVPHVVHFLRIKIKYIWRIWGSGERILLMRCGFRGKISMAGPQPCAVDPSFILNNSYLFPVFMAKNQ